MSSEPYRIEFVDGPLEGETEEFGKPLGMYRTVAHEDGRSLEVDYHPCRRLEDRTLYRLRKIRLISNDPLPF